MMSTKNLVNRPELLSELRRQQVIVGFGRYLRKIYEKPRVLVAGSHMNGLRSALRISNHLRGEGVDVTQMGKTFDICRPIFSTLIRENDFHGGVYISGGNIFFHDKDGWEISDDDLEMIEGNTLYPRTMTSLAPISILNVRINYMDKVFGDLPREITDLKGLRVVYSGNNIRTHFHLRHLCDKLRATLIWDPGKDHRSIADKYQSNHIVCYDKDGERLLLTERDGNGWKTLTSHDIAILLAHFRSKFLDDNYYIVITELTSTFIERMFPFVPIYVVPPGFRNISETIRKHSSMGKTLLIGFDEYGRVVTNNWNMVADAFQASIWMLAAMGEYQVHGETILGTLRKITNQHSHYIARVELWIMDDPGKLITANLSVIKKITRRKSIITWETYDRGWIKFDVMPDGIKVCYSLLGNEGEIFDIGDAVKKYLHSIGNKG